MAIKEAQGEKDRIAPHLIVRNATEAVGFYKRALDAVELYRSPLPGGMGTHFHLRIGKTFVMVTDEAPPAESHTIDDTISLRSPQSLGGTSMVLEILVDSVDTAYKKAVDAGATPVLPISDCFWGDRYGWVRDPYGHIWALATVLEELTPEEVKRRMDEMMAGIRSEGSGSRP
jgi:uncharacterized glyoxalase superfamily protein PhnB